MKKIINWTEKYKSVIEISVSVISTILVLFTLYEMREERNAAYRPDIFITNTAFAVVWNETGDLINEGDIFDSILEVTTDSNIINKSPKLELYNLGVGNCKEIGIDWHFVENINKYIDAFNKLDDFNIYVENDNSVCIKEKDRELLFGANKNSSIDFIANSIEEYSLIVFPSVYHYLNFKLIENNIEIPDLLVSVSYEDIQGKKYSENTIITIRKSLRIEDLNGCGGSLMNVTAQKEKNMFNFLGLTTDDFVAITSFLAVIVSVISVCFTYKSNKNQIEHNKNSVKPLSSIKVSDYEDRIAVSIFNHGTGPLLVIKMIAKNNSIESNKLIDLMPYISQNWTTFSGEIDGIKIPVGGGVTLIELNPSTDDVKKIVREHLKDITIYLEYKDIYGTEFKDQKKLDFFGRHFVNK